MPESQFWVGLLQIIWIDILLSGDNAVVIALACRRLPEHQRRWGIMLGAGAAIGLRVVFAIFVVYLLGVPYLKLIGAVLLLWIAVKLILPEHAEHGEGGGIEGGGNLWSAVRTIVIADAVMSLDNVIAIGAAAKGDVTLLVLGLLISIPLIVWGSTLILRLLDRMPWIMYLGGGLLGYIAGEIVLSDPALVDHVVAAGDWLHWASPLGGVAFVLIVGGLLRMRMRNAARVEV